MKSLFICIVFALALKPAFNAAVANLSDNAQSAMVMMMVGTVASTADVVDTLSQNDYYGSEALIAPAV